MNGATALPLPVDDPEVYSDLVGVLGTSLRSVDAASASIGADATALAGHWAGEAGPAAVDELDRVARPLRGVVQVVAAVIPGFSSHADRLAEARLRIEALQERWDEANAAHASAVAGLADLGLDEAGEWHERLAAGDRQAAGHAELRRQHRLVLDDLDAAAVSLASQVTRQVEAWIGPVDLIGGATSALVRARARADGVSAPSATAGLAIELADAIDEFGGGDLVAGSPILADLRELLATIRRHRDDPKFAATVLNVVGASRWLLLPGVVARWIGTATRSDQAEVLAALDDLGRLFATASHTMGRPGGGGLSREFVADLTGIDTAAPPVNDDTAARLAELHASIDRVQRQLTAAGIAVDVAEPIASATGAGRLLVVLKPTGKVLAVLGGLSAVVDVIQAYFDPSAQEAAVNSVLSAGLTIVAAVVSGGPVAWVATAAATLFAIVGLVGRGQRPSARSYPPGSSPGGSHYDECVDGAGVPALPRC